MNPLATYFLSVLKNERTCSTRAFMEHQDALAEMGYWLLQRPADVARKDMPTTRITEECRLVDEFVSYQPAIEEWEGFAVMVDVYADPIEVDQVTAL